MQRSLDISTSVSEQIPSAVSWTSGFNIIRYLFSVPEALFLFTTSAENAEAFTSANAYVFTPDEKTPSLAGGLIVIKTDATVVNYTITITDGEGTEAVYNVRAVYDSEQYNVTVTSADGETAYSSLIPSEKVVYFDLYEQDDVASIKIETTEDATVRLFTNEG